MVTKNKKIKKEKKLKNWKIEIQFYILIIFNYVNIRSG